MNTPDPQDTLVTVTGAAGYIGSHTIRELLARGYRVRGTVRSLAREKDLAHLRALPGAARLELVEADLRDESGAAFAAAVRGARHVLHLASPFAIDVKDPQRDLVDPAVRGTTAVLKACAAEPDLERVVVTSSMAAITDEPESDRVLTEADWNTKSSLERNPYYYSKTLAERAAWDFMSREEPRFRLLVINPFLVIGPSLSPGLNPSNQLFVDLLKGVYPGIMNLTWGFVDVRDVALAHVLALTSEAAEGRHLCAADTISMREVVALLSEAGYTDDKLPRLGMDCALGDYAVKLSSYLQPKGIGSYLRTHVGRVPRYDNSKIQRALGLKFRDVRKTILETLEDLKRWGHLSAPA